MLSLSQLFFKNYELFLGVFTIEPWNDDWSDQEQLNLYLKDLIGQSNSLIYGLIERSRIICKTYKLDAKKESQQNNECWLSFFTKILYILCPIPSLHQV